MRRTQEARRYRAATFGLVMWLLGGSAVVAVESGRHGWAYALAFMAVLLLFSAVAGETT